MMKNQEDNNENPFYPSGFASDLTAWQATKYCSAEYRQASQG
jgi:hypothetical protein